MKVGQWIRLSLSNPINGALAVDMNGGYMPSPPGAYAATNMIRHMSRITALGATWLK